MGCGASAPDDPVAPTFANEAAPATPKTPTVAPDLVPDTPAPKAPRVSEEPSVVPEARTGHEFAAKNASEATQIFLTHDWGVDELGRSTHARVAHVNTRLKELGVSAWFDEEEMKADINAKMADGIESAETVGVFVTRRYIEKASGKGPNGQNDNCKFEFDMALRRKGVEKIIVMVLEPSCRNQNSWKHTVGGKLGGLLYIDMSSNEDSLEFEEGVQRLVKTIRDMAGAPQKLPAAAGVSHPQPSHPQCSHPQQQLPKEVAEQLATVEAPPTEPTILLKQLSVDQVCNLLHSLEMGNYAAGCREQKAETKDAAPASDEKENAVAATTAEGGSNEVLASSFGRALELSSLLRRYAGQNSN
ncbi:hypothetical protein T484DRAFT_2803114 [Baffinella frigidus]|nr:hypothetical protein T484DRAFT_2803114 [Cryptophyta sp. CCMP2293]